VGSKLCIWHVEKWQCRLGCGRTTNPFKTIPSRDTFLSRCSVQESDTSNASTSTVMHKEACNGALFSEAATAAGATTRPGRCCCHGTRSRYCYPCTRVTSAAAAFLTRERSCLSRRCHSSSSKPRADCSLGESLEAETSTRGEQTGAGMFQA
jgi:hypothetical protein